MQFNVVPIQRMSSFFFLTSTFKCILPSHSQYLQSWLLIKAHKSQYFGHASRMNNDVNLMKTAPAGSVSGNAISSMGISVPPPVENTPVPASQPSPRIYQERVHVSVNTLPEFNSVSALCFFTVSPYASVGLLLQAEWRKLLTVNQIVTPQYHQGL